MWQHRIQPRTRDEYICIVPDPRPRVNSSEADEEIDRRFCFQIAHAIAHEGRFSFRARADVPDHGFLTARTREKRLPIEVLVVAGRIESQRNGVQLDSELLRQWLERLFNARGDEMDHAPP